MEHKERIHVIACGVLAEDIRRLAAKLNLSIDTRFLKGGLHETPTELRHTLQESIDEASASGQFDRIVVGYGICGRGTVGIESRGVPLILPLVHDCISLFMGSAKAYKEQFTKYPGTFYISAGWQEEKAIPLSQRRTRVTIGDRRYSYTELLEKYGTDNARHLFTFLTSWQRNYQRAAFIDTGAKNSRKHEEYARAMAKEFGWKYERIEGNLTLLEKLLKGKESSDEILVVPPLHRTTFDPISGAMKAHPILNRGGDEATVRRKLIAGETRSEASQKAPGTRIGLGIDAGGTYTDAVIYDLSAGEVLCKKKGLTTRWDFTLGIGEALEGLDRSLLKELDLVALSTTLATNALVEGKGQKVGLLVMPPYGLFAPGDIAHEPKAVIAGRIEITGEEISPIDREEVRAIARDMADRFGVEAFAVSGFAGSVNPKHEQEVKTILREETGLFVTCGHELSDLLDFRTRAQTAVANGRIIPLLAKLLQDLERVLRERGIDAPIAVVKGDGTLISKEAALERPVETILSGPAASVAGARLLTGREDAIVVDMGGTTTDVALIEGGNVKVCGSGSDVGGFRTHVRALEIGTTGLGGDSFIAWWQGKFEVGPRRVAPVAWLGVREKGTRKALDYLARRPETFAGSTRQMQLVTRTADGNGLSLSAEEREILGMLKERPASLHELGAGLGIPHLSMIPLARLEEHHAIQRCGFTPTDLLNTAEAANLWDASASRRMSEIMGEIVGIEPRKLVASLWDEIVKKLALLLLKRQLGDEGDSLDHCKRCRELIGYMLAGGNRNFSLQMKMRLPLVGIGAPVHHFLPRAGSLLGAEVVLPEHGDVANAIGAVTSRIEVRRQIKVQPGERGGFIIEGLAGAKHFADFDLASDFAEESLVDMVRRSARACGTSEETVEMELEDHIVPLGDGTRMFLGRTLTGRLSGEPDLVLGQSR